MKELIRIIDSCESKKQYAFKQFSTKLDLINLEVKNVFRNVTTGMIKSAIKFNHYRIRDHKVNNALVDQNYPQYNAIEN